MLKSRVDFFHKLNSVGLVFLPAVLFPFVIAFTVREASQHEIKRNKAYAIVKQIAYNIFNWWKTVVLPEEKKHCEIETVRREIINVPGNIVGRGRYKRIRLAANRVLEWIVQVIKRNFDRFFYTVASGFQSISMGLSGRAMKN